MNLIFHQDAGHGWLGCKRELLANLGLEGEVSSYSYQRGKTVYLEEDCDAQRLLAALKEKGVPYVLKTGKSPWPDRSPIRSYERFRKSV